MQNYHAVKDDIKFKQFTNCPVDKEVLQYVSLFCHTMYMKKKKDTYQRLKKSDQSLAIQEIDLTQKLNRNKLRKEARVNKL